MLVLRHIILCLLIFLNARVLASNLASRESGLADIPPCGVSRPTKIENHCAKACIDTMHVSCDTDQRLLVE
jgi:hypothetical protein